MAYDALKKHKDDGSQYERLIGTDATGTGAMAQVLQAPTELAPQAKDSGPTASGYVNFDSLYNANSGVAQREATQRADSAQTKAKAAQQGLAGAQNQYNSLVTGATQAGPTSAQQAWAKSAPTGVAMPKQVTAAYFTPSGQSHVTGDEQSSMTETQEGLESSVLPPKVGADGKPIPGTGRDATGKPYDGDQSHWVQDPAEAAKQNAASEAAAQAGAKAKYQGPNSLSDLDQYNKLFQDTTAAEQGINNPLTGLNDTDRALLGAAGRTRFASLQQQYGGLTNKLEAADKASAQTSANARNATAGAASAYQGLLDERGQNVAADQKAAQDSDAASNDVITKAREKAISENTNGPEGVWAKGSTKTVTNPDGTTEEVWTNGYGDAQKTLFGASYDEARDPGHTMSSFWSKQFGIPITDADYIRSTMTPDDYAAYQQATHRGPTAVKKWFASMLARRQK